MANLQLQILLKEKNRLMLNLVPISFLLSCALSAAFPSSIDLAAKFEQGMSHLELPQSFFNKLIRKPVKTIKVFRAPKIFMDDFHVKLSEDFKSFHVDGITSEGYGKATLVTGLEQAHIVIPGDLTKWKYGTSGKLWTSNYVRMKEYTRLSKDESWIWDGKIAEQKIVFSAMRYKGKRLGNGKRENDVFVIEKFLSLDPIYRPVPKPKTVFR